MDAQLNCHLNAHPYDDLTIKEEHLEYEISLTPPPGTPAFLQSSPSHSPSNSTRITYQRHRPYPIHHSSSKKQKMMSSNGPNYSSWTSPAHTGHGRGMRQTEGKAQGVDRSDQITYPMHPQYMNDAYLSGVTDIKPISSTSSLTNAMGEVTMSSHPRSMRSPGQSYSGSSHNPDMTPWVSSPQPTIAMTNSAYPVMPGHSCMSPPDTSGASAGSSPSAYEQGSSTSYPNSMMPSYPSQPSPNEMIQRLRQRIQELEYECSRSRAALASMRGPNAMMSNAADISRSPSFQAGWQARTAARTKLYCSVNRAGNALCSWHDSRREKRKFHPRTAPEGYLNCGCTVEEALFEESLSRHNVGSYLPGETVRMDPALRNPLLKLLEMRYGYKDGDFERDPVTGQWRDGEDPYLWEQKAQSGQPVRRRQDAERH